MVKVKSKKKRDSKQLSRSLETHIGLNIFYGCVPGGFGKECENCCALTAAQCLTGRNGQSANLIKQVICNDSGNFIFRLIKKGSLADVIFD